jgi:hypothetical protein
LILDFFLIFLYSQDDGIKVIINSILDLQFILSQELFQLNNKKYNKKSCNVNTATIVHHIDINIRKLVGILHKKLSEYNMNNNNNKLLLTKFNNESKIDIIKLINETKGLLLESVRDGLNIIMVNSDNYNNAEKLTDKKIDDNLLKNNEINIDSTIENYNNIYLKSILYKLLENNNCYDDCTNSDSNIEYISINDYLINFIKDILIF